MAANYWEQVMETVNAIQSCFERGSKSASLQKKEESRSGVTKESSDLVWYILRTHYHWPLFEAVRLWPVARTLKLIGWPKSGL